MKQWLWYAKVSGAWLRAPDSFNKDIDIWPQGFDNFIAGGNSAILLYQYFFF